MSWAPTTDLKNYVFLSVEYTSVTKNGSELKITLKTEVASGVDIELYVEEAFDNPTADASSFRIKTEYTCNAVPVILDDDSTLASGITLSSAHTLTVKTGSGNSIGSAAIT